MLNRKYWLIIKVSHETNFLNRLLLKEEYSELLLNINGIAFTRREIDIIACILAGRTAKKIAELLFIAPRTVENHIQNIMDKLRCNTRASIIEFFEKSLCFSEIKLHYSELLIKINFKETLKRISLTCKAKHYCLIDYDKRSEKAYKLLFQQIISDLSMAGINASLTSKGNHQDNVLVSSDGNKISHFSYTFLILDIQQSTITIKDTKEPIHSRIIQLKDQENYYFLVLELIKQCIFNIDIEETIKDFKIRYTTLFNLSSIQKNNNFNETHPTPVTSELKMNRTQKRIRTTLKWSLYTLGLFFIIFTCLQKSDTLSLTKFNIQGISLDVKRNPPIYFDHQNTDITNLVQSQWNLPRQDHVIIGRKKIYQVICNTFKSNKKELNIMVLTGLGGIGKTQLALQYARHTARPYTLKAWFQAENLDQLNQSYIQFAKTLGLTSEESSMKEIIVFVNKTLSKHPGWLLVYDNVNSYEEIEPYLPESGGHILITSRSQLWPNMIHALSVGMMTENESLQLLHQLIHHHTNVQQKNLQNKEENEIKMLSKMLGYLPLALAQAGSYINQSQMSVQSYLDLYKKHSNELLNNDIFPKGTHSLPVSITWNTSFESIINNEKNKEESLLALHLL